MARKKDPEIKEEVKRGNENEQESTGIDAGNNNYNDESSNQGDTIKNANATGLGSMGRNDEKRTDYNSNLSGDTGNK